MGSVSTLLWLFSGQGMEKWDCGYILLLASEVCGSAIWQIAAFQTAARTQFGEIQPTPILCSLKHLLHICSRRRNGMCNAGLWPEQMSIHQHTHTQTHSEYRRLNLLGFIEMRHRASEKNRTMCNNGFHSTCKKPGFVKSLSKVRQEKQFSPYSCAVLCSSEEDCQNMDLGVNGLEAKSHRPECLC